MSDEQPINIEAYYLYVNGYMSEKDARDRFGDRYGEVAGAKLMRESIDNTDDFYLENYDLSP